MSVASPRSSPASGELWKTMGVGSPPTITTTHMFSRYHPMIPRRYVPQWQNDMKNRKLIIENCKLAGITTWTGHHSYFFHNREQTSTTNYPTDPHIVGYSRHFQPNASHFSKHNSALY